MHKPSVVPQLSRSCFCLAPPTAHPQMNSTTRHVQPLTAPSPVSFIPDLAGTWLASEFSRVVLPEPLGPMRANNLHTHQVCAQYAPMSQPQLQTEPGSPKAQLLSGSVSATSDAGWRTEWDHRGLPAAHHTWCDRPLESQQRLLE